MVSSPAGSSAGRNGSLVPAVTLLEIQGLTKHYPGALALDRVDLTLEPRRVDALVGENGAGKSTLIRMLAGVERPDAGAIRLDGDLVPLRSPADARRAGIAVVHQRPHLIPELSVMENLALRRGHPRAKTGTVDWAATRHEAVETCAGLLPGLDVARPARELSAAEQTLVELGFAFAARPRIPGPRRAHRDAPAARRRSPLRAPPARGGGRCERAAGHAPPRRGVRPRPGRDRAPRRPARLEPAGRRGRPRRADPCDGRAVRRRRASSAAAARRRGAPGRRGSRGRDGAFREARFHIRRGEVYGVYGLVGSGPGHWGRRCSASGPLRAPPASTGAS